MKSIVISYIALQITEYIEAISVLRGFRNCENLSFFIVIRDLESIGNEVTWCINPELYDHFMYSMMQDMTEFIGTTPRCNMWLRFNFEMFVESSGISLRMH